MKNNPIVTNSGAVTKEIILVDLVQYNFAKITSTFFLKTSKSLIIFDVGTSNDIHSLLSFMNKNKLSLKKIRYLVPSHHHFDHFGGGWKLWGQLKKFNQNIKVLTTPKIKKKLQKSESHLIRVQRTFGDFIGLMEPLPEEAFELIDTETDVLVPGLSNSQSFQLVETPGHSQDHLSPWFRDFIKEKFTEGNGSTRYIVEEFVKVEFEKRVKQEFHSNAILLKTVIALVYGQLIDLGLKQPK